MSLFPDSIYMMASEICVKLPAKSCLCYDTNTLYSHLPVEGALSSMPAWYVFASTVFRLYFFTIFHSSCACYLPDLSTGGVLTMTEIMFEILRLNL